MIENRLELLGYDRSVGDLKTVAVHANTGTDHSGQEAPVGIPKALPAGRVQRLLDNCDRRDPVQVRDYAILMLVARLGLRSIEVARLQLDDIDWRPGRIILCGKASHQEGMPLPTEVCRALAEYLTECSAADAAALDVHLAQSAQVGDQAGPGQRREAAGMRPGRTTPRPGPSSP